MKRTPIVPDLDSFPRAFHSLLAGGSIYDSSCSPDARVWFIDKDGGFFLKSAPAGTLRNEADMTRYFNGKGLGAQVLDYESGQQDWLLTKRLAGEDCLWAEYLADPVRLCDTTAELLRQLHDTPHEGCPRPCRTADRLAAARKNFAQGRYDTDLFPDNWGYSSPAEAIAVIENEGHFLRTDTLLHGDYCLPNILLDNWRFSGFIDLGAGGVGDRHMDLFWGIWSLKFNLKTDRFCQRFVDAYGRQDVEEDALRIVAAMEVFGE